jgi:hypothetical protein
MASLEDYVIFAQQINLPRECHWSLAFKLPWEGRGIHQKFLGKNGGNFGILEGKLVVTINQRTPQLPPG